MFSFKLKFTFLNFRIVQTLNVIKINVEKLGSIILLELGAGTFWRFQILSSVIIALENTQKLQNNENLFFDAATQIFYYIRWFIKRQQFVG